MDYPSERCHQQEAIRKQKYCKSCKKLVLAELKEAGYLQHINRGHVGDHRTAEARELTWETKSGTWHG